MAREKPKKMQVIYKGTNFDSAEAAGLDFWQRATPEQRLEAATQLLNDYVLIKGLPKSALRLQRTTAVIKRQ